MNCVGIDVSKGKSMIAVMRPFGEVVVSPFEVRHTASELSKLAGLLKSLDGETRVVMESTGNYHAPVAWLLHDAGLYVSVVNAMLVHDYGNNSLRRGKTDKKDAVKLANYGLDHWLTLPRYVPEEDTRLMLKTCYRQYQQYSKVQTMLKNNLISLLDTTFPDANRLFTSPPRTDGSEKWVDFVAAFWHCECVCGLSEKAFAAKYQKWCRKHGYHFSEDKALDIYASACGHFGVMPKTDTAKLLVEQAIFQLRATSAALAALKQEMQSLAASLPEYPVVMEMFGVGPTLGPQLMAEIGDVRRFHSKKALVAFAGIDAPPYQSGQMDVRSRSISKRGSAALRRTLFLVMGVYLQSAPMGEPVYQFMDKKRSEGKPYRVYMMASANKFLRIYYASVTAYGNAYPRPWAVNSSPRMPPTRPKTTGGAKRHGSPDRKRAASRRPSLCQQGYHGGIPYLDVPQAVPGTQNGGENGQHRKGQSHGALQDGHPGWLREYPHGPHPPPAGEGGGGSLPSAVSADGAGLGYRLRREGTAAGRLPSLGSTQDWMMSAIISTSSAQSCRSHSLTMAAMPST